MARMIQVRNVPAKLHRELVRRAKLRGQTLTAYVQDVLEREVAQPPLDEVLQRIADRTPVDLGGPAADFIRAERAGRRAS